MINVRVKTGLTDVACHSELSSLKALYQEESSENKLVKQLLILARRYLCVFSFHLVLQYHGDTDNTCCVRTNANLIPVNIVL